MNELDPSGFIMSPKPITDRVEIAAAAEAGRQVYAPTPEPADLEQLLASRETEQAATALRILSTPQTSLEEISANTVPSVQRVAAPFRQRAEALEQELRQGVLTETGYNQRVRALREEYTRVVDEQVFGPAARTIAANRQWAEGLTVPPELKPEHRQKALAIYDEVTRLTPNHGLPRLAEELRDAVRAKDFGAMRALVPYLKSERDKAGSAYGGQLDPIIGRVIRATRGWEQRVGENRLAEMKQYAWQLDELRKAAVETFGDLGQSMTYRMRTDRGAGPVPFLNLFVRE